MSAEFVSVSLDILQRLVSRPERSVRSARWSRGRSRQETADASSAFADQRLCNQPEFDGCIFYEAEPFPALCGCAIDLMVPAQHPALERSRELCFPFASEGTIRQQPDGLYDCYTVMLIGENIMISAYWTYLK
jgi:hypothetical protein